MSETKQQVESSPRDKLNRTSSTDPNGSGNNGAEEESKHSPSYRHVPQFAASQFTLTTTVESPAEKGPVYKLSKAAMKFHLGGPNGGRETRTKGPKAPSCEQIKALKTAQSTRERQDGRNQVHQPLPTAFEVGMISHNLPNRSSFHANSRLKGDRDRVKNFRRKSTGSILGQHDAPPIDILELADVLFFSPIRPVATGAPGEHRVDWTQSDEAMAARAINIPQQSQPKLRKPESRWALRGRLGSFGRHSKDDKPLSPPYQKSPQDLSPKSPISGFFSRFKR
ncbi:uncharacterized protein MAM_06224 [Metarhizium album ARSEF 1941]|uniref:Uncharacterized protein n=1 Tax=Metarhizium album (strain ARSEF 1941) TaxID=1081103 RepID=A0A0B2WQU4_METAS|nr:uncharacterized protein MAM_06224 [Metarhizium album ARSEF 1941]KHN95862.1 hypothetical protein MAM_06224 [Metarhizium album ARSEF 1941]